MRHPKQAPVLARLEQSRERENEAWARVGSTGGVAGEHRRVLGRGVHRRHSCRWGQVLHHLLDVLARNQLKQQPAQGNVGRVTGQSLGGGRLLEPTACSEALPRRNCCLCFLPAKRLTGAECASLIEAIWL